MESNTKKTVAGVIAGGAIIAGSIFTGTQLVQKNDPAPIVAGGQSPIVGVDIPGSLVPTEPSTTPQDVSNVALPSKPVTSTESKLVPETPSTPN